MNKLIKHTFKTFGGVVLLIVMVVGCNSKDPAFAEINDDAQVPLADGVGSTYIVDKDGSGDFEKIQDAIDNASNGDTIVIYPGVYEESLEMVDKTLSLQGTDRDTCIVRHDSSSYFIIPLNIANGKVSNLTIEGVDNGENQRSKLPESYDMSNPESVYAWQLAHSGYAIHIDWNNEYNGKLEFENCKIISESNYCVGIGTRGNYELSFKSCQINSVGSSGCIFLHNMNSPIHTGRAFFRLENCTLVSEKSDIVMSVHSMGDLNPLDVTFVNNVLTSKRGQDRIAIDNVFDNSELINDGWNGLSYIYLTPDSCGNSLSIMNY